MAGISNQEVATNLVLYLVEAITNPASTALFVSIGTIKLQSISDLADILKQTTYEKKVLISLPSVGNNILKNTTQKHEDWFSLPSFGNGTINKTTK